ncbi:Bud21p ASCRUDRAFT_70940 [Ascoidea rubescens DSM 1968]|uniref:Uncharacterized protein n=1 Tax=Ascoidea rubescens DSM 1968 TaxID=1344418 RepID=A0A1D2VG25_9ASCO|nr:hypothetical protein ASCRUDRAFT_70940 [Ascoidea rubescens DSM 1968]ODV60427.1 hypothetical protein ASCRUDRAFT_70940 [Ascoidea rubescens DSM 1968]
MDQITTNKAIKLGKSGGIQLHSELKIRNFKRVFTEPKETIRANQKIDEVDDQKQEKEAYESDKTDESDESDESDDDAPEEDNIGSGKKIADNILQEQLKIENDQKLILKDKRRLINEKFKKQQEDKQLKLEEKEKENKKKLVSIASIDNEIPDFLPEELLESAAQSSLDINNEISKKKKNGNLGKNDNSSKNSFTGKHIKLDQIDIEDLKKIKQKIKAKNLKKLKKRNQKTIKRGPVKVTVLSNTRTNNLIAPSSEKIIQEKNKWLKRKVLGKSGRF